jgi:hypothetical protein
LKLRRAKGSPPKKAPRLNKGKDSYSIGSKLAVVQGGGVNGYEFADE